MSAGPRLDRETCGEVMSYALKLANPPLSYDRTRILEALLDDSSVRTLRPRAARRFAERTADKALVRVATRPPARDRSAFLAEIADLRRSADAARWPGRAGPTDRRVLEGAYLTAELARSTSFGLSARTWGVRVGLPWRTVLRSRDRLIERGALAIIKSAERSSRQAARYRIGSPFCLSRSLPEERNYCDTFAAPIGHDAFRPPALGCIGWFLLRRLDVDDAVRHGDLATGCGLNRERVYASLGQMQRFEIARRVEDGWIRSADVDELLIRAAATFGTLGSASREVGSYIEDRRTDPGRLAEWRKNRARPLSESERRPVEPDVEELEERALEEIAERSFSLEEVLIG